LLALLACPVMLANRSGLHHWLTSLTRSVWSQG